MKGGRKGIRLRWLDKRDTHPRQSGVTWGVPWPKGRLLREQKLSLVTDEGDEEPVQSWPAAYWPDGSVKWTSHAAVLSRSVETAEIAVSDESDAPVPAEGVTATETEEDVTVDTGVIRCMIGRTGTKLILGIQQGGKAICSGGWLTAVTEAMKEQAGSGAVTRTEQPFESVILHASIEQRGPVRAVVKVTGKHRSCGEEGAAREWLPFTVRMYFYAGQEELALTHTFVYDGDPEKDAIKGLGLRLAVPMDGPLYNRHVRLAGDTGWFAESPKGLMLFRLAEDIAPLYKAQQEGKKITLGGSSEQEAAYLRLLDDSAVWNDFRLTQLSADSYVIRKRTGEGCSWIRALNGKRARGVAYVGSEAGGIGLGVRNFWQQYPSGLEPRRSWKRRSRVDGLVLVAGRGSHGPAPL